MPSAGRVRWAKFRALVVSLVAGAIMGTLFYLLTGGTVLKEKTTLTVYVPDATGIGQGAPVRVNGIGVGKVSAVELTGSTEPGRTIKVTMTVDRARLSDIPIDSFAQLGTDTMVGDRFIAISSGKNPRRIQPNGVIPFREDPELLQTLDLSQFEARLRTVDAMLTDIEQGRSRVGQFITGEKAYSDVLLRIGELESSFEAARESTSAVGRLIYSDQLHRQVREPIMRLDATLARIQSGQGEAGRFLRDPALHQEMLASTEQLKKTIVGLRTGSFASSDTAWQDWNRRVSGMIRSVDEFTASPLFSTTQTYDNLNGAAAEMRDLLRDFRSDPKKFLRVKVF